MLTVIFVGELAQEVEFGDSSWTQYWYSPASVMYIILKMFRLFRSFVVWVFIIVQKSESTCLEVCRI